MLALIIDDDPIVHILVSKMLVPKGYEITSLKTEDEINSFLTQPVTISDSIDIIFLDLQLGELTGEIVYSGLKNLLPTLPPIILMSSNTFEEARELFTLKEEFNFLHKPFISKDLYGALEKVIGA